jgi:cyclic pyranopterin phosphate synthase
MASEYTFLDPIGRARIGESSAKEPVHRRAVARCKVRMLPDTADKIATGAITKGDVLSVARVAGIQAAKQTANFIPLCHPVLVQSIFVNFRLEENFVEVESQVDTVDRTGVEMEALTACTMAALTVYDMCKSVDRTMEISDVALWEKSGGSQGPWRRSSGLDDDLEF